MATCLYTVVLFVYLWGSPHAEAQARNVARSGHFGEVNLVEVNIKDVIYGRCSFAEPGGEKLELLYEDREGELSAKAVNPTITDPISKAQRCREVASQPIQPSENKFKTVLSGKNSEESPWELSNRLDRLRQDLASNEVYLSYLKPRFIGEMFQNFGITLGGNQNDHQGGFGIHIPQDQNKDGANVAIGLGAFKPWGWRRL